jgi:hypothetical protein
MPDATEWLVEYLDSESETRYERIAERDDAIEYLRQLVGQGKTAFLYQRIDFTVQIGVTVKAPRKRRKTPPPADQPGSDSPTGPGNGEAGEPIPREGRSPADVRGAVHGEAVPGTASDCRESTEESRAPDSGDASDGEKDGAPKPEPAPIPLWDCEARLDSAPPCPGPIHYDTFTHGRFCSVHMPAIQIAGRMELHRRNHARNRPVRVAHAG